MRENARRDVHPAESMDVAQVEACLRGEVAFPHEPADVSAEERSLLWCDEFSRGEWYQSVSSPAWGWLPFTMLMMLAGGFTFIFCGAAFAWLTKSPSVALGIAGGVSASVILRMWFKARREIASERLYAETARLLHEKQSRWKGGMIDTLADLSKAGVSVDRMLTDVAFLVHGLRKPPPALRAKLGTADTVAMMRLSLGLREARLRRAKRIVIEGETSELLHRAFEALGGRHPVEVMRL